MLRLIATPTSAKSSSEARLVQYRAVLVGLALSLKWLLLLATHHALNCLMMTQISLNQMFLVL